VYASVVGGVKLGEPAADLGLCLALVSAISNIPLPADLVVIGEVGLAGEVRQVGHLGQRLNEAARLGFTQAIVPASAPDINAGISVKRASTLNEAIALAGVTPQK
jgi:DNA repair protein RadA/Sms